MVAAASTTVHALDTRPGALDAHGYAMMTRCGLMELEGLSAIFDDDALPKPDKFSRRYRWCGNCKRTAPTPGPR